MSSATRVLKEDARGALVIVFAHARAKATAKHRPDVWIQWIMGDKFKVESAITLAHSSRLLQLEPDDLLVIMLTAAANHS